MGLSGYLAALQTATTAIAAKTNRIVERILVLLPLKTQLHRKLQVSRILGARNSGGRRVAEIEAKRRLRGPSEPRLHARRGSASSQDRAVTPYTHPTPPVKRTGRRNNYSLL